MSIKLDIVKACALLDKLDYGMRLELGHEWCKAADRLIGHYGTRLPAPPSDEEDQDDSWIVRDDVDDWEETDEGEE